MTKNEIEQELHSILKYWTDHTIDTKNGGFIGRIDENDNPDPTAAKGLVLNARILWTFSATNQKEIADRAYNYLINHFLDKTHGGLYWNLDPIGQPLDTRKQIYGQAFGIYAFSEYYKTTKEQAALQIAIDLFHLIEQHSFDPKNNGYYEAFTKEWSMPEDGDLRLSPKDTNAPFTMNTHLHILEAYTNLYKAWPDKKLHTQLLDLIHIFEAHIVDPQTNHLNLFFDTSWNSTKNIISYGHDIEAAWLLQEAGNTIGLTLTSQTPTNLAIAAAEGLDTDGGLWYENQVHQKHWWPQAEAMVGFLHIYKLTGEKKWLDRSTQSWNFVKTYLKAPNNKEWYWGVEADHTPMKNQDKAGFWKCPYHNTRACLQILSLIRTEYD